LWDDPQQDGLARYWKTTSRDQRGQKKEEIRDFLSTNPYKMETMLEEEKFIS
jgi:hypothetical protein